MTRDELRRWRERQEMTQEEAEVWYSGHGNGGRTWRRYESDDRAIPGPLIQRIKQLDGKKVGR